MASGEVTEDLLVAALGLAFLEFHARNIGVEPSPSIPARGDLDDLLQLLALVPDEEFEAQNVCILNPTFGEGSRLVGGADGDALLNQALLEIKTITTMKLERDMLNQLAGYYVLSRIGDVSGEIREITEFAVYYSRFGKLIAFPVSDVTDEDGVAAIAEWFKSRAR